MNPAEHVAAVSEETVRRLWAKYLAGQITAAEFREIAADTVASFNDHAAEIAVEELDSTLTDRPDDTKRLLLAFATVMLKVKDNDNAVTVESIARLARAEPLAAAQHAVDDNVDEHWVWVPSSGACALCQSLAGTQAPGPHHPGCVCTQEVSPR